MACRPWARRELALVKPRALVLLGATAAQRSSAELQGDAGTGRPLASELADLVIRDHPPSAVLRAENRDEMFAGLVEDLRVVLRTFAHWIGHIQSFPLWRCKSERRREIQEARER